MGFHAGGEGQMDYDRLKEQVGEEVENTFQPEFLNRLDDIIVFHPLTKEQIGEIVHIMLRDVRDRLSEEQLSITLTDDAVEFLVEHGYDQKFGARPLKRTIQRYIEDPLSEKILMAEFAAGDEILVDVDEEAEEEALGFRATSPSSAT
jgi:ATP-dependent Clp protease ATP-binding subunit ClpC